MSRRSRREFLAGLTGAVAVFGGCSSLGDGSDDATPTDRAADDGTPDPNETATENEGTTPTETDGSGDDSGGVERATSWPNRRGPPSNTGASATGGPGPNAAETFSAALRDGIVGGDHAPVVGPEAIYAIGRAANPYDESPPTFACYVYAFSREDGSELWRRTLERGEGVESNGLAENKNLCLGSDGLYAAWIGAEETLPFRLARLSTAGGSEQWRYTVEATAGRARQPVVRDGVVYQLVSSRVVALDTRDGSELWRTEPRRFEQPILTVGSGVVGTYHGGSGDQPAGVTAFDAADGSVRWSVELTGPRRPIPAIAGETLYIADGDSFGLTGLSSVTADDRAHDRRRIHALSLADGTERWHHTYDTDEIYDAPTAGGTSYVTVTDDHVYYALGFLSARDVLGPNVVALDRADGSVAWRTKVGSQARVFQPMVAGPDNLYALYRGVDANDEEPRMYVIDRRSGDVRGSFGPVEAERPFAVADGTLYVHRQGDIAAWE